MNPAILPYQPGTEFPTDELCHVTELSNSTCDEGLSVALVRVEPGVTTQWHHLQETCERYVISSGQGRVEIGDLPPQNIGPNDVVIIPPGKETT